MTFLSFLYETTPGRILLRPLAGRPFSALSGWLLDRRFSACLIPLFIKMNKIDTEEYDLTGVRTFNEFFRRPLKQGRRPVDRDPGHLIAPCDGYLTVYPVWEGRVIPVKQIPYTAASLLRSDRLAARFKNGTCFVFRLCVNHYHRYCYADSGRKSSGRKIKGVFHTVRPAALKQVPVFAENSREYTLIRSDVFGPILQMEVGAMLVGRIRNHRGAGEAVRGEEKGMFEYGGSTIILLLGDGAASVREDILQRSAAGEETPVRLGEMIARHGLP